MELATALIAEDIPCVILLLVLIRSPVTMGRVATVDAQRFMMECLKAVGAGCKPATQQAEMLIEADKIGHASHGLNRLELYVNDIAQKRCMPNNAPLVLKEYEATAWVDANNVLGATASHFGMDLAIKKAQKTGVGWVSVKGSNHNGMVGFWAKKAACKGMIGMAFTNTPPVLAPTRSKKAALGTNPLSVVAKGSQDEMFYLDMATTTVSFGKIEMLRKMGKPLPGGWAQGPAGKETLDAEEAHKTRCLMPLGGGELTSGFKGFGLAAVVEMFCGVLAGANYGHLVRNWPLHGSGEPANFGQCFVAVNPGCFAPGFRHRITDCMLHWRSLEPTDPSYPVLCPGDMEKQAASDTYKRGTVSYHQKQIDSSAALAKRLNVKPMTVLK